MSGAENQPSAEQPPAVPRTEPDDWSKVKEVRCARVCRDSENNVWRIYECDGPEKGPFKELIWPVYVPRPASESAGDQGGKKQDDKASDGSPAVSAADKYWAEAAGQARSTAKWIATSLGAALAAIIGTAPLTPTSRAASAWYSGLPVRSRSSWATSLFSPASQHPPPTQRCTLS
jgi:hypothetical protein